MSLVGTFTLLMLLFEQPRGDIGEFVAPNGFPTFVTVPQKIALGSSLLEFSACSRFY
jgi:hypothetical protein